MQGDSSTTVAGGDKRCKVTVQGWHSSADISSTHQTRPEHAAMPQMRPLSTRTFSYTCTAVSPAGQQQRRTWLSGGPLRSGMHLRDLPPAAPVAPGRVRMGGGSGGSEGTAEVRSF